MTLISVRNKLQGTKVGLVLAGALILVAVAIIVSYYFSHHTTIHPYDRFYSDDDGKTYFKDSIYKFAPWDHDGRVANIAIVATDGKQTFVTILERFTPDAKKKLQEAYEANSDAPYKIIGLMASPQIIYGGMEFSLPGSGKWTFVPWERQMSSFQMGWTS